jgi:hypothetical protein
MKEYIKVIMPQGNIVYRDPEGWYFQPDSNNPRYTTFQAEIIALEATETELDLAEA